MDFHPNQSTDGSAVSVSDKQKLSFIDQALEDRKAKHQFRTLSAFIPGDESSVIKQTERELLNFCSNDYLGLSRHSQLKERARKFVETYGSGSTASRLISGTYTIHQQLEEKLAAALNTEATLLFNSGFQANSTIVSTLTNRYSLVLADKLSHNSLLQGALLSRADFKRFEHNDMNDLKSLLDNAVEKSYDRIMIITETVFSMDGDRAKLEEIASLADRYNAMLFVDDAHAVGVWGEDGWGLAQDVPNIDILLGTCGKAFGVFGAYVACSKKMRDYLVNFCPGFIYTTSLPPAVIGALDAAVELIPNMENERKTLHRHIRYLREEIQKLGFETGNSTTQIIPIIIGDEKETIDLSEHLHSQGILASAIRPPTVPEESSRIRITLTAAHSKSQIDHFLEALGGWKRG